MPRENYSPVQVVDTDGMANDVWLKYRTTGIGGSDVAAIYEVSGWTTKRALYYAKLGLEKGDASNPYTLDFGHAVEPFVAAWFQKCWEEKYKEWLEKKMGIKIDTIMIYKDTMMYQHPKYPFMQANLDYRIRVYDVNGNTYEGIFECKTTSYHIGEEKWADEQVPPDYEYQCRHYMSIMNLDFCIIAALWGNNVSDYVVRYIPRDYDIEEEIIEMEEDFWYNNVLAKNPPALSVAHAEQEMEAFKSYKIADRIKRGEMQELALSDDTILKASKRYLDASKKKAALKAEIEKCDAEMANCNLEVVMSLADKLNDEAKKQSFTFTDDTNTTYIVEVGQTVRKTVDSSKLKEDLPDIWEKYLKKSVSDTFKIKAFQK